MQTWRVAALLALSAGCSTPYQPKGAIEDYQAGSGTVMVTFEGNGYTSESAVVKMWHRRAAEVCGGTEKYKVVRARTDADVTVGPSTSTTNVVMNGNSATATTTTTPGAQTTRHRMAGLIRGVDGGSYNPSAGASGDDE